MQLYALHLYDLHVATCNNHLFSSICALYVNEIA